MPLRSLLTGALALIAAVAAAGVGFVAGLPEDAAPAAPTAAPASPSEAPSASDPASPTASATPSPEPTPTFADRELAAHLERLVEAAREQSRSARLSARVITPEGASVLAAADERPSLPASAMKLVTAASALATFGADHRFTTEVRSDGEVNSSGVLDGDLVLVGGGDPALGTPAYGRFAYPARPRTPMEDLAAEIDKAGIERVDGDVLGIAPDYDRDTLADGWLDGYLSSFDARHITGLTVDGGLRLRGGPGRTLTGPLRLELAERPTRVAAVQLSQLLAIRDIEVTGRARRSKRDAPAGVVARVASPPLSELLEHMVQTSDNHMADTLFKAVGAARDGTGTWESGATAARATLADLGVEAEGARFADGSGLSRRNRLSARQLTQLDAAMALTDAADVWSASMAVTGREGTLENRLAGTVAEGRFRGKTGSLTDVTSLAGSVTDRAGTPAYHLAVIGNDADGADRGVVRTLADRIVLALAADVAGCDIARPRPPRKTSPPPSPGARRSPDPLGLRPPKVDCPETETSDGRETASPAGTG